MTLKKQFTMFKDDSAREEKYSKKIEAPIYEPSHEKPHILTLYDPAKTKALIRSIEASGLPEDEKEYLLAAAWRHTVFHYERAADYYAHSSQEMKKLMEDSALVIIDFDAAIERGFVKLCSEIREQFLEEYGVEVNAS